MTHTDNTGNFILLGVYLFYCNNTHTFFPGPYTNPQIINALRNTTFSAEYTFHDGSLISLQLNTFPEDKHR